MSYQEQPPASGFHNTVISLSDAERGAFLKRTYLHLFAAMAVFAGLEAYFLQSGVSQRLAELLLDRWWIAIGGLVLVSWIATRTAHRAASPALQYAALGGFVLAEAVVFAPMLWIASTFAPGVIQSAAAATLVGFALLTAVVFVTGRDFSFLRSALIWLGLCALGLIVCSLVFGWVLGTWFSVGMIAFAGAAILYDTSNILHHYPADRHVGAALELFASVAMLFWYVLRLFMARD